MGPFQLGQGMSGKVNGTYNSQGKKSVAML